MTETSYDLIIVGAGAAGMTAAIFAGREAKASSKNLRIALLDGARKPGAKILVSGGGRCNVTNETVTEKDFFGGSSNTIRNVLRQFDHKQTVEWMKELGVSLKLEPRGKLFPTTDKARTVLDALFNEIRKLNIEVKAAHRVKRIEPLADGAEGFFIHLKNHDPIRTKKLILSTGGRSLPKSGSDGWGLEAARKLGHQIVATTPALVPLTFDEGSDDAQIFQNNSGASLDMTLCTLNSKGKSVYERTESLLLTHFGISGPVTLDVSRHFLRLLENKDQPSIIARLPNFQNQQQADQWLQHQTKNHPTKSVQSILRDQMPQQLARKFGLDISNLSEMKKDQRQFLSARLGHWKLPILGSRGYPFAETTAGGVSLTNINWKNMQSRKIDNLYFCGEMLDVDGRLGGFNFQWAWSSGFIAGKNSIIEID